MKLNTIISAVVAGFLFVACGTKETPVFEVTNPFNEPVRGKAIVLDRSEVEPLLQGKLANGSHILVTDGKGRVLASQMDDLDGDGTWDELVFLADFHQNETVRFGFKVLDVAEMPAFPRLTNVQFAYKNPPHGTVTDDKRLKSIDSPTISALYQMEGPGWENDIVGFRNYYDARNGIDIFGKRTTEMILEGAGIDGQDYHTLDDWGMDILKVGNSLGAGAIAIGVGEEIYRVGPSQEAGFRLVSEGPVRSVLDLTFEGVPAGDRLYDVTHRIFIYAGDHFYRSQVWVKGLHGDEVLYTGIVDLYELETFEMESAGYKVFGTHGNQGFDDEILGLGILIPANQFLHAKAAPKEGDGVVFTHLTAIQLTDTMPAQYAFFAGWELQDPGFTTEFYFRDMLSKAAYKLDSGLW
jgi:hypothetical protein